MSQASADGYSSLSQDWMLIALSVVIFHAKVTSTNIGGYLVAFGGVCFYNYSKFQAMQAKQREKDAQKAPIENESKALLSGSQSPTVKQSA